ncbi:MAG: DMT family transporter, partial [Rhizobiaceae bacterium]
MDSVILEGSSNKSGNAGEQRGIVLVILSAVVWSFGGAIARYLDVEDTWTQVFWRSGFASVFLFSFLVWRDGFSGALSAFAHMGWPGFAVALCFGTASTSFVLALAHTTVANILLINAGVPLIAALLGWILFRTRVSGATWLAIAAVIGGVAIMVSESLDGKVSPIGDLLALTIS